MADRTRPVVSPTTFLLVRHGDAGTHGTFCGRRNPPLSRAGLAQARLAARAARHLPVTILYSSDLSRCRDTARPIGRARGCRVRVLPTLRERRFGDWEGCSPALLASECPEALARLWNDPNFAPRGGESLSALERRVFGVFGRLARHHPGAALAVVAHGGVHRALLRYVCGMSTTGAVRTELAYGHGTLLQWFPDGGLRVAAVNLPPEAWSAAWNAL